MDRQSGLKLNCHAKLLRVVRIARLWNFSCLCFNFQATSTSLSLQTSLEDVVGKDAISVGESVREHHGKDESYYRCVTVPSSILLLVLLSLMNYEIR